MTARIDLVGIFKQIIPLRLREVLPKCTFFNFGVLHGNILTFFIFKKPFNTRNRLTPQNNSTVQLPDSILQHWKPPKQTIVAKKMTSCYFPA